MQDMTMMVFTLPMKPMKILLNKQLQLHQLTIQITTKIILLKIKHN